MVKKFTIPFASQGDANDIPDALQVDGKVSFTQGFGYDYERPYDDPQAKDIAREDMNGLFKAITSAVGELQTLGASEWSNAISYPKGAIVYYEKDLYISQIDDNQNTPPQNWVSITSIANDSLKKAANLSDLTNKATARNNLGLGSSATLNKTDVLGTSTSLVATQKLVNDTKINLESSKQDKLTFTGTGNVARMSEVDKKRDLTDNRFVSAVAITNNNYRASLNINELYQVWLHQFKDNDLVGSALFPTKNGTIALTSDVSISTPVGIIQAFIGENAPNDRWLLCRGQAFSAANYPALAQLLPDLKIPDLRGVALRGLDANRGFDPNRKLLSYQEDAMQKIAGEIGTVQFRDAMSASGAFRLKDSSLSGNYGGGDGTGSIVLDSTLVTRSNTQNETTMKNVAVNFIIKAR